MFPGQEESVRRQLIEVKTFLAYQRQLVNLGVPEGRLRRQAEKDLAALQALQRPRLLETQSRLNEAARAYIVAVRRNEHEMFDPAALGFEFTVEQIELRALDLQPDLFHDWAVDAEGERDAVA